MAIAMGGALYRFVDWPLHRHARRLLQSVPAVRSCEPRIAGSNPARLAADEDPAGDVPVNQDTA